MIPWENDEIYIYLHLHDCKCKESFRSIIRQVSTQHTLFKLHSILIWLVWLYYSRHSQMCKPVVNLHLVPPPACQFKFGLAITYILKKS